VTIVVAPPHGLEFNGLALRYLGDIGMFRVEKTDDRLVPRVADVDAGVYLEWMVAGSRYTTEVFELLNASPGIFLRRRETTSLTLKLDLKSHCSNLSPLAVPFDPKVELSISSIAHSGTTTKSNIG
jgi:hypothetical protein